MRIGNQNCALKEDLGLNLSLKSYIYYHKTVVQRDHKLNVIIMHMHDNVFFFCISSGDRIHNTWPFGGKGYSFLPDFNLKGK